MATEFDPAYTSYRIVPVTDRLTVNPGETVTIALSMVGEGYPIGNKLNILLPASDILEVGGENQFKGRFVNDRFLFFEGSEGSDQGDAFDPYQHCMSEPYLKEVESSISSPTTSVNLPVGFFVQSPNYGESTNPLNNTFSPRVSELAFPTDLPRPHHASLRDDGLIHFQRESSSPLFDSEPPILISLDIDGEVSPGDYSMYLTFTYHTRARFSDTYGNVQERAPDIDQDSQEITIHVNNIRERNASLLLLLAIAGLGISAASFFASSLLGAFRFFNATIEIVSFLGICVGMTLLAISLIWLIDQG